MSKTWKIILASVLGLGIIAVLVFYFWDFGNYKSKLNSTDIKGTSTEVLEGHFESHPSAEKSELVFYVDGPEKDKAKGAFQNFKVVMDVEEKGKLESAKINLTIESASVNTKNETRDSHLKGEEFFNTDKYPEITFTSEKIDKVKNNTYKMTGTLKMLESSENIIVPLIYKGHGIYEDGDYKGKLFTAFTGEFSFDMTKYGMRDDVSIADVVEVEFIIEMVKGQTSDSSKDNNNKEEKGTDDPKMPVRKYDNKLDQVVKEAEAKRSE